MRTIAVVRFMYNRKTEGAEKAGMVVIEIPHDKVLNETELLTLVKDKGYNATRIIHNDEDIVTEWVALSDSTLN